MKTLLVVQGVVAALAGVATLATNLPIGIVAMTSGINLTILALDLL